MYKRKKQTLTAVILILVLLIAGFGFYAVKTNLKDRIWLSQHVNLVDYEKDKPQVKVVSNEKAVSYLNLDYQQTVTNKINKLREKHSYTISDPLMVLNPYGTNTCSLNLYFNSEEKSYLEYTISVEDKTIDDFTRIASCGEPGNLTKTHAYQLTGFIQDQVNKITFTLYNIDNQILETSVFEIDMPSLASGIMTRVSKEDGKSSAQLSEGLYALFGHSENFEANIYLYDNEGILRGELPIKDYRSDRILFIDQCMVYSYDENKIAKVNKLGQIIDKYIFSGYELHHDFGYDEKNNKIIMLASKNNEDTIEDQIIQLDLKTGKTTELIDFRTIMPECYQKAVRPEDKKKLDWIHFNSMQVIDGTDLILSSRETSSIIRVNNIYEEPKLQYLLSDQSMWENSAYEDYVYDKVGDFTAQAGQHTVTYVTDDSLEDGRYYLYMYNNNMGFASTMPEFQWKNYKGVSTYKKTNDSFYYKYLVDENAKTFELVNSFPVPYSLYVSSAQQIEDNVILCSSLSYKYGEYDNKNELIREFTFLDQTYTYRIFKYNFNDFFFYYSDIN